MAQQSSQGILDRIFARFQAKKGTPASDEKEWIDDPNDVSKKIKNPKFKQDASPAPQSITDLYAGLYEPRQTDQGKQAPTFNLTPDAIGKAAGKMDFVQGLPPELLEKIQTSNGSLDFDTISQIINHAGRAAYSRAMEHSSALTGNFVEARVQHERQGLPEALRLNLARNKTLSKRNIDNPVVREHLALISEKVSARFPDATEDEVAELTHEYFTTMAREINPDAFQQQDNAGKRRDQPLEGEIQDYDSYLNGTKSLDEARQPVASQSQGQSSSQGKAA